MHASGRAALRAQISRIAKDTNDVSIHVFFPFQSIIVMYTKKIINIAQIFFLWGNVVDCQRDMNVLFSNLMLYRLHLQELYSYKIE